MIVEIFNIAHLAAGKETDMKIKKIAVTGTAAIMLVCSAMTVSAAEMTISDYVNTLKKNNQVDLIIDVDAYRASYDDLDKAFGDDSDAYIEHYLTMGIYEGRTKGVLFDPILYTEAYDDILESFGYNIPSIINHYITFGLSENRTQGTACGYADLAAAESAGALDTYVRRNNGSYGSNTANTGNNAAEINNSNIINDNRDYHHSTSIYTDGYAELLRVEYYDDNNRLVKYSSVTNYDGATNSYTENIYHYDEKKGASILERTDTYVNGVLVSSVKY